MDDSKKIIKLLERINSKLDKIASSSSTLKEKSKGKKILSSKPQSLTGLIIELKSEGYFDKPKTLNEITRKLEEQGWHYPKSSLTHPLQRLLRKRSIGRVAIKGKWAYVKR